ncbi:MAG: non-hydrolyzing UDP-N-acetylglucosamine 2-epimerase [Promethearchaeota archaeon]
MTVMVKKSIYLVAGARPNFMKIAPIVKLLKKEKIPFKIIHTGQHYDYNMSKIFFDDLGIPQRDIYLNVGSASHAVQTARIMIEFEKVLLIEKPLLVIVVGDVNSTIACALVAKKLNIKIAHVEAGLRSFDQTMPEEINRILTDQLSDFLFITEESAEINLKREGIDEGKIFFVGNVMIDTLILNLNKIKGMKTYEKFGLKSKEYALMTIHRPSNVDNIENFKKIIKIIHYLQKKIKIFIPMHPRTRKNLKRFNLEEELNKPNVILNEPISYSEFLNLIKNARLILTDSGGIQEEASYLKIPILTLRENTERPITVEMGTNTIVGTDFNKCQKYIDKILANDYKIGKDIKNWDGKSAKRIIDVIKSYLLKKNK